MHPLKVKTVRVTLLLSALVFPGCSGVDTSGRKDVYPVSGKVTMSGGPVANAAVTFSPKAGQPVATGRTDDQGQFALTTYEPGDGAAAGEYAVLVTKSTPSAASAKPAHGVDVVYNPSHSGGRTKAAQAADTGALPAQYSDWAKTPLSANVEPGGKNEFNFELTP